MGCVFEVVVVEVVGVRVAGWNDGKICENEMSRLQLEGGTLEVESRPK